MKNLGKISLIVLFLFSIFVGSFTVYSINKVQSYGTLINYLGIVRGATQRLIKLELQHQPHDELIAYIDDIIYDLKNTDGKYGLEKIPNADYQQQFSALTTLWHRVKSNIYVKTLPIHHCCCSPAKYILRSPIILFSLLITILLPKVTSWHFFLL